jgi:hypothetical protein
MNEHDSKIMDIVLEMQTQLCRLEELANPEKAVERQERNARILSKAEALMRDEEIRRKAKALVEKIEAIHADNRYRAVWEVAFVHGYKYDGPQYVEELSALKTALAQPKGDEK